MLSFHKGVLAFYCGMILLAGHFISFLIVWTNSSISPTSKNDITAILIPITVASVTSAVLYATKHGELDLRETPRVNAFFVTVSVVIPVLFFAVIFWGLFSLDGERKVDNFKTFIVAAEAMFGGIFVIVTEALFSNVRKLEPHRKDISSS